MFKGISWKLPCPRDSLTSLGDYAKNFFVKKCPNCRIITEKKEGCNHITCSKCSCQWCWLCNEKYEPEHYDTGKCKGLQFYKPKDEKEIQLVFEGKIKPPRNSSSFDFDIFIANEEDFPENRFENSFIENNRRNISFTFNDNLDNSNRGNNSSERTSKNNIDKNNDVNNKLPITFLKEKKENIYFYF